MVFNGFTKGILIGVGVSAVAFYAYKRNEEKVDDFLRAHGVPIKQPTVKDYAEMSLEELMQVKEDVEDIIAEREINGTDEVIVCEAPAEA